MMPELDQRSSEHRDPMAAHIAVLTAKVETMHSDFRDMRTVLQDLTAAINKLALVEERQSQFAAAQERAFAEMKGHGERIRSLELRVPDNDRAAKWVDRVAWAAVAAVAMFIAKNAGLL